MSNVTLATFEQAVAKKLGLYHAFAVTTEGDSTYNNFMATECKRYANNALWNKWVRIITNETIDRQIKSNVQERGEIFFYEPHDRKISAGDTIELTNYNMADIDTAINEAIEMCFPELSVPVQDKTLTVSSITLYHAVPSTIRKIMRVEICTDTTESESSVWYRVDWEEAFISGALYLVLPSYAYAGAMIKISGIGTYGSYTTPASTLDIPEEWKRVIIYGAVYNLLTAVNYGLSGNDSAQAMAVANAFFKEYEKLKVKFAQAHFAFQTPTKSFEMQYEK